MICIPAADILDTVGISGNEWISCWRTLLKCIDWMLLFIHMAYICCFHIFEVLPNHSVLHVVRLQKWKMYNFKKKVIFLSWVNFCSIQVVGLEFGGSLEGQHGSILPWINCCEWRGWCEIVENILMAHYGPLKNDYINYIQQPTWVLWMKSSPFVDILYSLWILLDSTQFNKCSNISNWYLVWGPSSHGPAESIHSQPVSIQWRTFGILWKRTFVLQMHS